MKTKMGRPRKGSQIKEHTSIRIEPKIKNKLIKRHGSIQAWADNAIEISECVDEAIEAQNKADGSREGVDR